MKPLSTHLVVPIAIILAQVMPITEVYDLRFDFILWKSLCIRFYLVHKFPVLQVIHAEWEI